MPDVIAIHPWQMMTSMGAVEALLRLIAAAPSFPETHEEMVISGISPTPSIKTTFAY
jgi:hypothetical protein